MVLEGASTSPFVCAALRVGRGRRQTVQLCEVWEGLSAFLGKLVTDLSASRSATNYSQICRLDGWLGVAQGLRCHTYSTEVPGFLNRRARAASRTWFGLSRRYMYIDISSSPEINHVEDPDFGGKRLFSRSKHLL